MKKVIALVMCVAMIACVAVTANAATKVTLTIDTVEYAKVGDIVTVNVNLAEKDSNIGALGLTFDWDDTVLEAQANRGAYMQIGAAATGSSAMDNIETKQIELANAYGIWDPGAVVTIQFKVLKDIEGTAPITATVNVIKDANGDDMEAAVVDGGVKVKVEETKPVEPVEPQPPVSVTEPTDTNKHPGMGDTSAIAVAAGLCAVMAAGFVFAKKAR